MNYEKIALVCLFLGILIFVQFYLRKKYKEKLNSEPTARGLKLLSRLNLSRTSHLDLITTGQESFLIITSKNAQSTVVPLSRSDSESEVMSEELPYA